jgi:hypothetical protein
MIYVNGILFLYFSFSGCKFIYKKFNRKGNNNMWKKEF